MNDAPTRKRKAIDLVRKGRSYAAAAAATHLHPATVRRACEAEGVSSDQGGKGKPVPPPPKKRKAAEPAPVEAPAPVVTPPSADTSLEAQLVRMGQQRDKLMTLGESAERDGNIAAATKSYRDAAKLADTIETLQLRGKGSDLAHQRGTAFGVYSAVTEYLTHLHGRAPMSREGRERRLVSNMAGPGAALLSRAASDEALAALRDHAAATVQVPKGIPLSAVFGS